MIIFATHGHKQLPSVIVKKEGYKLSDEELESVSGGAWSESTDDGECPHYSHSTGDEREDVDPAQVPAGFVNGAVDGGEDC